MLENKKTLGTGWGFPPQFTRHAKQPHMVSADDDIEQALKILFSTVPGERVMQPDFGCGLKTLVFENISESTITQIKEIVRLAILFHEPRIDLEAIDVVIEDEPGGIIEIELSYTVRGTNSRRNMVYPFYYLEGTNLWDLQ